MTIFKLVKTHARAALLTMLIPALSGNVYGRPVELKLSTLAMEGSSQMNAFHEASREIEEKTGGAVSIKMYTGGAMGTGDTLFRKLRFGQLDGGSFTAGEASTFCPDLRALSIAFMINSYEEIDHIFPSVSAGFREELRKRGYVVLSFVETGFSYLMGIESVSSAADLRGRDVWVPSDDWVGQVSFRQFGVVPKPLSLANASTGLMTGMVDTVAGPFIAAIGLQWINKVRYVLDVPLLYTYGILLISERSFQKIPEQYRDDVTTIFEKHQDEFKKHTREENRKAREAMKQMGIKFISPSPEDLATWPEMMISARDEMESRGIFTEGLIGRIAEMVDEFRKNNP